MPITGTSRRGISASVTAAGIASKTTAKQPTDCRASVSSASLAAASAVRPWALKPPSADAVCGVRPTWPITGMPELMIARARSTETPPRSSLTASQPDSLTKRWALSIACSFERSYEPKGRSPTSSGVFRPRRTAEASITISSMPTGGVESWPSTTIAAVSPTRTMSTPASSATCAEGKS